MFSCSSAGGRREGWGLQVDEMGGGIEVGAVGDEEGGRCLCRGNDAMLTAKNTTLAEVLDGKSYRMSDRGVALDGIRGIKASATNCRHGLKSVGGKLPYWS